MEYKEYIDLGFIRTDLNDQVELDQTGYPGFVLNKKINDRMEIEVGSEELHVPKLYIKKKDGVACHIIKLTGEMVKDIFSIHQ